MLTPEPQPAFPSGKGGLYTLRSRKTFFGCKKQPRYTYDVCVSPSKADFLCVKKKRKEKFMEEQSISLIIIIGCISPLSAYFSASGDSIFLAEPDSDQNMAEKGNKRTGLVLKLSENYDGLLSRS